MLYAEQTGGPPVWSHRVFKPKSVHLFCNEVFPVEKGVYPAYVSTKFDGFRTLVLPEKHEDTHFITRSMKPHANKRLIESFQAVADLCADMEYIADGEFYNHDADTFGDIQSALRNYDCDVRGKMCLHIFDMLTVREWNRGEAAPFHERVARYTEFCEILRKGGVAHVFAVDQVKVHDADEVRRLFRVAMDGGFEGLMFRGINSGYKHGRLTYNESAEEGFKFKDFVTWDGVVLEVVQREEMVDGLTRTRDAAGVLKRTHKQADYKKVDCAGSVRVSMTFQGEPVDVGLLFGKGWDMTKRKKMWKDRAKWVGRHVEFNGIEHGADVRPRSCKLIRARPDLD